MSKNILLLLGVMYVSAPTEPVEGQNDSGRGGYLVVSVWLFCGSNYSKIYGQKSTYSFFRTLFCFVNTDCQKVLKSKSQCQKSP